jgi:nicotinamidase-related amidase
MLAKNSNVNGPAPVGANTAVLVLDMISDFDFEDGDKLYPHALRVAERLAELKSRAMEAGVPVIFVNDNFGKWNEDFGAYVDSVRDASKKGRKIIELIGPHDGEYHILKPQRSAFYATPLGVLLLSLNVSNLILTGVTTDICVLFTAHDAYMRGFHVHVPSDCTAAVEESYHKFALEFLERVTDADTRPSTEITFRKQTVENKPKGSQRVSGQKAGSEF